MRKLRENLQNREERADASGRAEGRARDRKPDILHAQVSLALDGTPHKINQSWFDETSPDYVVVETTADKSGVVKGVFRANGSTSATFSGAQVLSDGLRKPGFGFC